MRRSTWAAVLVTAAILVVAGNLPRLPWDDLAAGWRAGVERRVAAWPRLARRASASVVVAAPVPRRVLVPVAPARLLATPSIPRLHASSFVSRLPAGTLPAAVAGALAGLVTLAVFLATARRDRRGRVWQLARRGLSPARIAPRARVPQDAVRTLLTPGVGARR